jgi:primosomal protein N''
MQILQKNINTSLKALNKLSDQIENQMLIQHNMYLTEKLLNSLQSVQRMITLASPRQEIVNSDLNCKSFYNRTAKRLITTINNF